MKSNISHILHREKEKKEKILKEIEDKKLVRAYEEQKAKGPSRFLGSSNLGASSLLGSSGLTGVANDSLLDREAIQSNHDLDEVWQNVRNFLDDLTLKGDKREIGRNDKPNRIKFTEACDEYDYTKNGVISEANLHTCLNRSRCNPLPTKDQLHMLCKALECYTTLSPTPGDDVNYRHFLNGPVHREFVSMNGIFPKIVSIVSLLIAVETQGTLYQTTGGPKEEGGRREAKKGRVGEGRAQA